MSDVTITIKRKKRTPSRGTSRRKGMLAKAPGKQDLGRRRLKKGGKIRFWDFGQYLDGTSIDHPFINEDTSYGPIGDPFDLITNINNEVLGVPDPFAAFKTLDKANPVARELFITSSEGSGLPADLTKYTGNTLEVTQDELSTLTVETLGQFLTSNYAVPVSQWEIAFKITDAPSYASPSVPFSPSVNMDIGFLPAAAYQGTQVVYASGPDSDSMNSFWAVVPRSAAPIIRAGEASEYAKNYDWWRVMRLSPHARAYRGVPPAESPIAPSAFAPASFYPTPPSEPAVGDGYGSTFGLLSPDPSGTLIMIVRKAGQIYYVWVA